MADDAEVRSPDARGGPPPAAPSEAGAVSISKARQANDRAAWRLVLTSGLLTIGFGLLAHAESPDDLSESVRHFILFAAAITTGTCRPNAMRAITGRGGGGSIEPRGSARLPSGNRAGGDGVLRRALAVRRVPKLHRRHRGQLLLHHSDGRRLYADDEHAQPLR